MPRGSRFEVNNIESALGSLRCRYGSKWHSIKKSMIHVIFSILVVRQADPIEPLFLAGQNQDNPITGTMFHGTLDDYSTKVVPKIIEGKSKEINICICSRPFKERSLRRMTANNSKQRSTSTEMVRYPLLPYGDFTTTFLTPVTVNRILIVSCFLFPMRTRYSPLFAHVPA